MDRGTIDTMKNSDTISKRKRSKRKTLTDRHEKTRQKRTCAESTSPNRQANQNMYRKKQKDGKNGQKHRQADLNTTRRHRYREADTHPGESKHTNRHGLEQRITEIGEGHADTHTNSQANRQTDAQRENEIEQRQRQKKNQLYTGTEIERDREREVEAEVRTRGRGRRRSQTASQDSQTG